MMIHYCEMKDKVFHWLLKGRNIWDEIFKNGPSKIFVRHPQKNLQGHGLPSNFVKAVFHKFYLVHS